MSKQHHSIAQHVFKISYPNKDKAAALQQQLIQLFKQKLYPALATYIDQHLDPNETIQIDSLVLDAGNIKIEDLENGLSEKVIELFKNALKPYIIKPYNSNIETALQGNTTPTLIKTEIELVAYYLLNGVLPSWIVGESTMNPTKMIEQLLVTNPQLLIQLLSKIGLDANVRLRITRQLPAEVIRNIIRQLSPAEADFIISYHKELSKAQEDKQLVKSEIAVFKQKVWEFILEFLMVQRSSVFSEQAFVKNTLATIAAYFNISYEEIVRFFYENVKSLGTATVSTTALQHIILSIGENLPNLKKHVNKITVQFPVIEELHTALLLNDKQLEAIRYFLLQGALPWWAKSNSAYDPAKLLLQLSKEAGKQLRTLLSTISPIELVAKNLAFLPVDAMHRLLILLEPTNNLLVLKYVQEINNLLSKTIITGAEKSYTQQKIWEKIFYYLLNNNRINFTENDFASNILHQLSFDLKINFELLILKGQHHTAPLLRAILSNFTTTLTDQKKSAQLENEQAIYLAAIDYYLQNGTFPVWAFVTNHAHATVILNELLKTNPLQTIKLLQSILQNSGALLLILKIADANTVDRITTLLIPAQHAFIKTYLGALLSMPINVQHSLGIHRDALYKMVLEYLFVNKSDFNKEDFLVHSLQALHQYSNISAQTFQVYIVQHLLQINNPDKQLNELLDDLATIKPMLTKINFLLPMHGEEPRNILENLMQDTLVSKKNKVENISFIKEDKKLFYNSILDALKYFTLYQNFPIWLDGMQQHTPNQLMKELLQNDTERAKQLFKFAGSSGAMVDFWLHEFELQNTEKLLQLFPQSTTNLTLVQLILTIFKSPIYTSYLDIQKTESLLIKTLWQAYVKTGYNSFDTTDFIFKFVKQYEFAVHIPEGYLNTDIVNKIAAVLVKNNFSFIAGKLHLHNRKPADIMQADKQLFLRTALNDYQLLNQDNRFTNTITTAISVLEYFIQWQKFPTKLDTQLLETEEMLAALIYLLAQQAPYVLQQLLQQLVVGSTSWHSLFKQIAKNSYLPNEYLQLFIVGANANKLLRVPNLTATKNIDLTKPEFLWKDEENTTNGFDDSDNNINKNQKPKYPLKTGDDVFIKKENKLIGTQEILKNTPEDPVINSFSKNDKLEIQPKDIINLTEQIPLPDSAITFRDIKDFIPKPDGWINGDDYLINGAEELLKNFLWYNKLPQAISNSTAAVHENWLKQLLLFICKKKPSLLGYLLKQDKHIAQNSITLHRIFSLGQNVAGRSIFTVLNQFIEKDIARIITAGSKIIGNHKNIRELLNQLKHSVPANEWTVALTKLIAGNKQLIDYLPVYLLAAEIQTIVQQQLSNEQSTCLRQLGALLEHVQLPASDINTLLLLYHTFMLQYAMGSKRGNFTDITGYFLSFVEKENDCILFRLLPVLLDIVVVETDEILFMKPISSEVKKTIIAHANKAAGNKLLEIPFAQQGNPQLLQPLTNPSNEVQPNTAESKIVYPVKPIEINEPMKSIYIKNAGLILFAPLLSTYFTRLSMLKDGQFISETETCRAIHLLEYIVDGLPKHEEHLLVLNKILCNLPLTYALTNGIELTDLEIETTGQLFAGFKQQWQQVKNSSTDGIRGTFLQRNGLLTQEEEGWNLAIEPMAYDVLLQTLPWGYGMIKTPWMDKILTVTWI